MNGLLIPADPGRGIEIVDVEEAGLAESIGAQTFQLVNPAEIRTTYTPLVMLIDEDGNLIGRPANHRVAKLFTGLVPIVGDVLLLDERWDSSEEAYQLIGIDPDIAEFLLVRIEELLSGRM